MRRFESQLKPNLLSNFGQNQDLAVFRSRGTVIKKHVPIKTLHHKTCPYLDPCLLVQRHRVQTQCF
jgi:hypothetical protein